MNQKSPAKLQTEPTRGRNTQPPQEQSNEEMEAANQNSFTWRKVNYELYVGD